MNRKRTKLNRKLPEFNKKLHKLNRKLPKLDKKVKVNAASNSSGADYGEIPILGDDFKSFQIPVRYLLSLAPTGPLVAMMCHFNKQTNKQT